MSKLKDVTITEENGQMPLSQKKIQHFAQFPKLIRECPSFETRFSQNRVNKKKIYGVL